MTLSLDAINFLKRANNKKHLYGIRCGSPLAEELLNSIYVEMVGFDKMLGPKVEITESGRALLNLVGS